ncbi:17154_t:CDS:2 [Acaulospora morrowiae]|uniref:17154_t:CDS:1 n=1 Tax=Acaulospora morrowiae TaxID=94023 RepID=A0A9N8YRG1_9GLOM|nr:17154_t:CDS:2 [Acaulospora morrowiae]
MGDNDFPNFEDGQEETQGKSTEIDTEMPLDVRLISTTTSFAKSVNNKAIRPSRARPNYFLSVRLDSEEIREKFAEFSTHVNTKYPAYKRLLTEPRQFHVTLFVFHLKDANRIIHTKDCLLACQDILKETCPDGAPSLHFRGIDTFNENRVVYTFPEETTGLDLFTKLTYCLQEKFKSEGIVNTREEFKPHATLLKIRRPFTIRSQNSKNQVVKRIPSEVFEDFKGEARF